ncbi:MAG: 3-hydroxybutyryl-CoA dehydrogenase, partial [Thermoleophilaceae bacterium]|nr:3-hydroxybutyryl-CoA dehydrogenase [Thermoleophilaceae bacterium]
MTPPTALPRAIGVVGAGTMGAGIAQLAVLAGIDTYLHDPFPEALERGGERVHRGLARGADRGRWPEEVAVEAEALLVLATSLDELASCDLVIEAAPERIELKRELFERLSEVCGPETVIGTNTSSILVSSLAGAAARPENVVG